MDLKENKKKKILCLRVTCLEETVVCDESNSTRKYKPK